MGAPVPARRAAALDVRAVTVALDELFSMGSYEMVADTYLMPAMTAVGDAWASARVSVAGEHLASHTVMRRLAAVFEAATLEPDGPVVLVGMPPGAHPELGRLAFSVAARRRGVAVEYLGADLPLEAWVSAVKLRSPRAVVLAIPTQRDATAAKKVFAAIREVAPSLLLTVGGGEQDRAPADVERLGHHLGPAAETLVHLLDPVQVPA